MKKPHLLKQSKNSTPATHRKTSSKVQSIYTPYRIDWKHQPLKSIQNQQPDFYRNMKNELNNIRNDVEKLIRREHPNASKSKTKILVSPSLSKRSKSQSHDISGISHLTSPKTFNTSKKDLIDLMESLPKGQSKFELLESKMSSLQLFNKQILDKLSNLQHGFKCSKGEKQQKQLKQCFDDDEEYDKPTNKQNNQMLGFYEGNTQRLEQKIEQFQKQMLKLQDIIVKMEESNIQLLNNNEMLKKKLSVNEEKLQKMSYKYSQKKKNYEMDAVNHQQEIQAYAIELKELQEQKVNLQEELKNFKDILHKIQDNFDKEKQQLNNQILHLKQQLNTKIINQGQKPNSNDDQSNKPVTKSTIDITKFQQVVSVFQQQNKQLMENIKLIQQENNQLQNKNNQLMIDLRKSKETKNSDIITSQNSLQIQNFKSRIINLEQKLNQQVQIKQKLQLKLEQKEKLESKVKLEEKSVVLIDSQSHCSTYLKTLQTEINRLQMRCEELQTELIEKDKQITNLSAKIDQLQINGIKDLGKQFEDKLNKLYDQNYTQKNRITFLESRLDEANQKKQSLQEAVRVYESIQENLEKDNKKYVKLNEKEDYERQIKKLKEQNQKLKDQYEMQIMKLENQIDQIKVNSQYKTPSDINLMLKNQLKQIQQLRSEIKKKNARIQKFQRMLIDNQTSIEDLNDKIKMLSSQNSNKSQCQPEASTEQLNKQISNLRNRLQQQKTQLQLKNKQLKTKQQFIRGALLGKIYKQQQQITISYLLEQYQRIVVPSLTTL